VDFVIKVQIGEVITMKLLGNILRTWNIIFYW